MGNQDWNPPVSFYFQVQFQGQKRINVSFTEVSGLHVELTTENLKNGEMKLPHSFHYSNLVLKRALEPLDEELSQWIQSSLRLEGRIETRDVIVFLMDFNRSALACWLCTKAYPVKWSVNDFKGGESGLVIETLELVYERLERKK